MISASVTERWAPDPKAFLAYGLTRCPFACGLMNAIVKLCVGSVRTPDPVIAVKSDFVQVLDEFCLSHF